MLPTFHHPVHGPIKLGKKAPRIDKRTLKLAKYLKGGLPAAPAEVSWITKVPQPWNMFLNDKLGDCVLAACGHMIMQWSFFAGSPFVPSDDQILTAYEAVGGYDPGNPNTDNGADMLTALNYWRQTGVAGHKILAFASVDWTNRDEMRAAIQIFGNVYLGVQLPLSAQGKPLWTVADGGIYTSGGEPGSWGGHCIPVMAESPETDSVITWGGITKMSHNFLTDYADEAFAVLSPEWLAANGQSPSGLDLDQLNQDLAQLPSAA